MRTFLRLLWDNFIFVFKIAVGLLLTIGLLRFVRSPNWQFFSDNVGPDATVLRNVETAVIFLTYWRTPPLTFPKKGTFGDSLGALWQPCCYRL